MREIKFRAWFKAKQEMISWKQLSLEFKDGFTTIWIPKNKSIEDAYDLDDIELMQYTGLKDKSGTEIYEGDIVKHSSEYNEEFTAAIIYDRGVFALEDDERLPYVQYPLHDWNKSLEVIGNVFEDSELLEVL